MNEAAVAGVGSALPPAGRHRVHSCPHVPGEDPRAQALHL